MVAVILNKMSHIYGTVPETTQFILKERRFLYVKRIRDALEMYGVALELRYLLAVAQRATLRVMVV